MDYKFKINDFEGPLDLLLHLIREKEMNIVEINVAVIAKQYVAFINSMKDMHLEVASEYLTMAAQLVEIKSKALLPKQVVEVDGEYEIDEREKLIARLLEYKRFKEVSQMLDEYAEDRNAYFTKESTDLKRFEKEVSEKDLPKNLDVTALVKAMSKMYTRLSAEKPLDTSLAKQEVSVEERIEELNRLLSGEKEILDFEDLFTYGVSKALFAITLIAVLDMAKNNKVEVIQDENFGKIQIRRRF